jgi:putative FmdB family regulatory protein
MPTYEYRCKSCGEHLEVVQSFKDDPLTECPACGGPLRKVFGNIGIAFKGSGFYKNDSRTAAKSGSSAAASASSSSDASSKSSGDSGKSSPDSGKSSSDSGKSSSDSGNASSGSGSGSGKAAAAS